MGSIVLDEIKVKNNVIPNLSRTKTIMQDAYSTCNTLKNSLPSSFSSRSVVSSIATKIASSEKKVTDVYNNLNYKMDYVKRIESKTESKVSSLASTASKIGTSLGMVTGAVVGSAGGVVGTAVGAATGAVVGKATGEVVGKIVETGAKVVKSVVSGVKNVVVGAFNFFKDTGAKIAEGVKSIWKKFSGAISNLYDKAKDVTINTFDKVKATGAKIIKNCKSVYSQMASGVSNAFDKIGAVTSKLCTSISNGVKTGWDWITDSNNWKKIGTKITNGVTAAWNLVTDPNTWNKVGTSICNGFKTAYDWVTNPENWKKLGGTIVNAGKAAWNWVTDIENWKKLGASIVNLKIAFQKGICNFAESVVDLAMLLGTALNTGYTAIYDVATAILTDGNLDWNSTKKMWNGTKSVVSYNFTNKVFDKFYSSNVGKWLDENAYDQFKSDGMACKISSGVGYVAGVVVLSIVTFGAGGAALGTAAGTTATIGGISVSSTAVGLTALGAGIGKYTAEEWNKNSLFISYGGQELELSIDYEKYKKIIGLNPGETTTIVQKIQNVEGNTTILEFTITANEDGNYTIIDDNGNNVQFNGVKESSTINGLLTGTIKGIGDGFKAFTTVSTIGNLQSFASMAKSMGGGNTINGFKNIFSEFGFKQSVKPLMKSATTETFKDYGFYVDVGTHIYNDAKSAVETGEWNIFKTLAKVGGAYTVNWLGNLGGEYFKNGTKNIQLSPNPIEVDDELATGLLASSSSTVHDAKSNIVGKDTLPSEIVKIDDDIISLQENIPVKSLEQFKNIETVATANEVLGNLDISTKMEFQMYGKSAVEFINDDTIPIEYRTAMKNFVENTDSGAILLSLTPKEISSCLEYSGESYTYVNSYLRTGTTSMSKSYMDGIVESIDSSIAKAKPLQEDTLFYRGVNSKDFFARYAPDGNVMTLKGKTISDEAFMSTSIAKNGVRDFDTLITIKTPEGTRVLNMIGINGNLEAEFLFSRNSKLNIEDIIEVDVDGKIGYNIVASLVNTVPDIDVSKLDNIITPTVVLNSSVNGLQKKVDTNDSIFNIEYVEATSLNGILESDSAMNPIGLTSTGTANLTSQLSDVKKFSDATEIIKEKLCSTYDLDYYNDENSRKIVNSIMNLVEKNEFKDESVRYLFSNLELLKKQNPNLSIGYWESGSKFWGGANVLAMDVKDLDISDMVLSHELGHAIYDTVEGTAKTNWQPELTVKNREALYKARENVSKNREKVTAILDECSIYNNRAFEETVAWYNGIREDEVRRVSDIVDELYVTQSTDEIKKIVESGSKMSQVKTILAEAGLTESSIDELISDKEIVKKIATTQNNINNQVAYCSRLNGSYEIYGDQRKLSSIIDSVTQSDEGLKFTFGHNKEYWQTNGDLRAYNELLADYVSLSANGRFDVLNKLEEVCGKEIFDDIRETLSGIVKKLGG